MTLPYFFIVGSIYFRAIIHVSKCGESRCGPCSHIITGAHIKLKNEKTRRYQLRNNVREMQSFNVGTTENLRNRETLYTENKLGTKLTLHTVDCKQTHKPMQYGTILDNANLLM